MDEPLDKLEIEIEASSNKAVEHVAKLANALRKLQKVASSGVSLERFKNEIGKLGDLKTSVAEPSQAAARQINALSRSLKNLQETTKTNLHIGNFKKELGKLGNNEYSKIEKLATALNGLKNIKLDEKVGNGIAKIAEACDLIEQQHIDRLAGFGNALQTIKGVSTRGFDTLPAAILNIAAAVDSITDDSIERLRRLTDALGSLRGVDLKGLGYILKNQNEAKKLAQEAAEKAAKGEKEDTGDETDTDKIENQISKIAQLKAKLKEALKTSGINAAKSAWKAFSSTIANAARDGVHHIFSLTRAIQQGFLGTVAKAGKSVFELAKNMATAPIRSFADRISELKKKLDGLGAAFARIMLYRGIRTVIKELGEAMKYGEENAYWFSKKFGDATHYISEAYDAYASATEMMKNQVGAAWATLFANIQPIIEAITDMVARAAQVVTQFFAALGGKTSYLKATKSAKDWKEETEDATKAAKEWKNQIMGFDEINRLEEQSDGSSSKIKDNTPDYGKMFEEVAIDSEIGSLADKMKELWNSQDWKGLGELIAQTLNDLFPDEGTWKKWGRAIGNGIDGAVQTAYYTLQNIQFGEWGQSIASGVNAALEEIDFTVWGRLLVRKTTAALDMAIGFIKGLDFRDLGKSIGDFFRGAFDEASEWLSQYEWGEMFGKLWEKIKSLVDGFDVPTFAQSLGNFIVTAANSAADFLNGIDFTDVVTTIENTLASFVDNVKLDEVKAALGNLWEAVKKAFTDTMTTFGNWLKGKNEEGYFYQLGQDFNTGITNLINDADTLFDAVPWGEIGTAISDFLEGLDWFDIFKKTWGFIAEKMVEAVKWVFSSDGETVRHIGEALLGIKLAFAGAEAVLSLAAQALVIKMLNPFGTLAPQLSSMSPGIGAALAKIGGFFTSTSGIITAGVTVAVAAFATWYMKSEEFREKVSSIWNGIKHAITEPFRAIEDLLSGDIGLAEFIGRILGGLSRFNEELLRACGAIVEGVLQGIATWIIEINDALEEKWNGFVSYFKEKFTEDGRFTIQGFFDGILSVFKDIGHWISEHIIQPFLKGFKDGFGIASPSKVMYEIGEFTIEGFLDALKEKWKDVVSFFTEGIPKLVDDIKQKWEELKKATSETWDNVKESVSNAWNALSEKASSVWDGIKGSISSAWDTITTTTSTVWDGITGTVGGAWDGIKGLADTAWGGVKDTVTGATNDINHQSIYDTQTLYNDVTGIYNDIDREAVRVFTDIAKAVPQIMNYVAGEFRKSVEDMANSLRELQDNVAAAMNDVQYQVESVINSIQSIDWSIPAPHIPHITVWYDTVWSGDGSSFQIPQFDVQWYARGGVFDGATLFGMGEAGAEAIVPLERNTEWIGKVASEMNRQQASSGYRDDGSEDIIDALFTVCDRIIRAMPDGNDSADIDMLAQAVTRIQRRNARAVG